MIDFCKFQEVQSVLDNYKSKEDQYMLFIKSIYDKKDYSAITDEMADYVICNPQPRNVAVNSVIEVSDSYAEERKNRYHLDFLPKHFYINKIIGESERMYAVMGKYRQMMNEQFMLLYKTNIVGGSLPTTVNAKVYTGSTVTTVLKSGKERTKNVNTIQTKFVKIDFDKYDKLSAKRFKEGKGNGKYAVKLLQHQKDAIKFMVASKKCILADGCGLGKTISAIVAALQSDFQKILVICPASIKSNWKREIKTYEDEDQIEIVKNKKWKESKWTIINYDILKNFYTIAEEVKYVDDKDIDPITGKIVKNRHIDWKVKPEYDEQGQLVEGTGIPKMKQSRNKDLIAKALSESQLYLSNFDLVIIDECHRLSNSNSNMCKITQDLLKRLNPQGIFAISGTPMTNRPMNLYNILKLIKHPICADWTNYVKRYCNGQFVVSRGEWDKWLPYYETNIAKKSWYEFTKDEKDEFRSFLARNAKGFWSTGGASNLDELRTLTADCYIRRINTEIEGMVKKQIILKDYDMTEKQTSEYNKVWEKYKKKCEELGISVHDENKQLTEGIKLRQFLSNEMVDKTIDLAEEHIENGSKVLILCNFDEELYALQKHFDKSKELKCVIYNGKMSAEQKDAAEKAFMNDTQVKVFIGNITAAGVGLTLTSGNIAIFNSFSWIPSDNQQAMDRVYRITQKDDVKIYFQVYNDTYLAEMYDKVTAKEQTINQVIVKRG